MHCLRSCREVVRSRTHREQACRTARSPSSLGGQSPVFVFSSRTLAVWPFGTSLAVRAQERHLAAGRFWAATIGSGIPQRIGYGPDRRLWHQLNGAACPIRHLFPAWIGRRRIDRSIVTNYQPPILASLLDRPASARNGRNSPARSSSPCCRQPCLKQ